MKKHIPFFKYVLIFFILPIFSNVYSQTWEVVYDSIPSMGRYIEKTNDQCFVVTGISNHWVPGLTLKIDNFGNIIWAKEYGGECIKQTLDNAYIIASGFEDSYTSSATLTKLDQQGNLIWSKEYGGNSQNVFASVIQTTDSGFLAAGFTQSYGDSNIYIVKTNSEGNLIWNRNFGGSYYEIAKDIIEIDGYYYIIGRIELYESNYWLIVIKLDNEGNLIWQKNYNVGFTGYSVVQDDDSSMIIAGGNILTKINLDGEQIWSKSLNSAWNIYSIHKTQNFGYILSGDITYDFNYQNNLLVKTDSIGDTQWYKIFSNGYDSYMDSFESVISTDDNGYLACGYSDYGQVYKLRVIKTDSVGDITTSIKNTQENNSLIVYPNPFNDYITIEVLNNFENFDISICDLKGQLLIQKKLYNKKLKLDLSSFKSGIYLLRLRSNNKILIKRIIKN